MNIQIFGKAKCFDTKKAERYFKERRIQYQYIRNCIHECQGRLKAPQGLCLLRCSVFIIIC